MSAVAHPWEYQTRCPGKLALVMADTGDCLTYGDMMRRADQAAHLFTALGCNPGDSVAILSENNTTYPELCWAAKDSGLHYACVSSQLNGEDAAYVVDNCDAKILLASQCPRSVDFVAELPRNEAGKLLKRVVKQRYWEGHQLPIAR